MRLTNSARQEAGRFQNIQTVPLSAGMAQNPSWPSRPGPAGRGGAHVGKAVPCGLGGPREPISGCLREAAGAELRRGRALGRGNTAPRICVRSVGDAKRRRSYGADPRL
jgi:hypothetical protein